MWHAQFDVLALWTQITDRRQRPWHLPFESDEPRVLAGHRDQVCLGLHFTPDKPGEVMQLTSVYQDAAKICDGLEISDLFQNPSSPRDFLFPHINVRCTIHFPAAKTLLQFQVRYVLGSLS